jgi:hypothetical protein
MIGQTIFDLGEPRQHNITFPLSLAELYRPQRLTPFAGLAEAKKVFAALLQAPRPCNLMLVGPPGTGKTTMALAFAELLPGTLHHISSQKADVAAIDGLWEHCQFCPTRGRFHVIILDEADEATERAQVQLLSRLDSAATLKPAFGGGSYSGCSPAHHLDIHLERHWAGTYGPYVSLRETVLESLHSCPISATI